MSWLLREGDVLAAADVAATPWARAKGLLGTRSYAGAMVLPRTRSIHTLGMHYAIDVAFCDRDLVVLDVVTMRRWRLGVPRWKARTVIEAEAGAFERWGLRPGDRLELRG